MTLNLGGIISAIRGLGDPYEDFRWEPTLNAFGGDERPEIDTTQPVGGVVGGTATRPKSEEELLVEGATSDRSVYTGGKGAPKSEPVPVTGGSTNRAGILEIAEAQIGSPYVWAEENPAGAAGGAGSGFDCSGFTKYVLGQLGIETPHKASEQQEQFRSIGREELQPGDLIFYDYGRLGPGIADHVAVYIGNGQQIAASSAEGTVARQSVDWDHFIGGGDTGALAAAGVSRGKPNNHQKPNAETGAAVGALGVPIVAFSPGTFRVNTMADVVTNLHLVEPARETPRFPGKNGGVKAQLAAGFRAAGREDLARMVKTRDFWVWVNAESGGDPYSVSPVYSGHGRNFGLFQFWEGHDWTEEYYTGGEWTATPFEQAKMVAKHFGGLTPGDIQRYADAVRAGTYNGWPD